MTHLLFRKFGSRIYFALIIGLGSIVQAQAIAVAVTESAADKCKKVSTDYNTCIQRTNTAIIACCTPMLNACNGDNIQTCSHLSFGDGGQTDFCYANFSSNSSRSYSIKY